MKELFQNLLKLQSLQFKEVNVENAEAAISEARAKIPLPILGHYDRLTARGKRGVAIVRNDVCTGCHMRLPIGHLNVLHQGSDLQICSNCGRYLVLPEIPENEAVKEAAEVKKTKKKKEKKSVELAAA